MAFQNALKYTLTRLSSFRNFSCSPSFCKDIYGFKVRGKLYNRQTAQDFIFRLNDRERGLLFEELQKFQSQAAVIHDKEKKGHPPTVAQLRAAALHNAIPFIGFGILDNCIMIIAGDYIDTTIGLTLGISTMAAAGLGNAFSDVCGIGSAYYVESLAIKIGIEAPRLTPAQTNMTRTRWCINLGRAFGVAVGCVIGMFPLLFLSKDNPETKNSEPN